MDKNHQMWTDLGMDVEKHDVLCEVLPQAFGDVFLTLKNRPESMDYFNAVVGDIHGIRPSELLEHQEKGGKVVGTYCIHVPEEVPIAAGAINTGLCSGSQFWVAGGEKKLPTNTCPLIKASLGARLDRTCPYASITDMFVGETTCDGKKKCWEIFGEEANMYVMDIPQMKREEDFKKWYNEILRYIDKVEELTGNKITAQSLYNAIVTVNNKRRALQRLNSFRKLDNVPISGLDVLLITQIAFFDDPQRCADQINILCDELEKRAEEGVSVYEKGAKRILVSGTPMSVPNWKIPHIVESLGGAVVQEEMCTGSRYSEKLVEEDENADLYGQVSNLANRYLGSINCACFTPNTDRIEDIKRLYREYNCDGVIDVNLKFCSIYDTEGYFVEKELAKESIPCLGIETDYTDADAEQLKTRIGAFLEMLD